MASSHHRDRPPSKRSQHPISLSRRLLFPALHSDDLPRLLASPTASPDLNAELYDFIALALRAYVNPWWTKITRYDKELLPHITRILAVVLRVLEARILAADFSPLVFHDIPAILTQHYLDYRNAASKLSTSYASGGAASLPQLFHQLQPHMALSSDGRIDHEYFRQVVDHVLKVCLPPEDYAPETERFLIREIILKVVLNDVIPMITQPWFIHRTMLDLLGPPDDQPLAFTPSDHPSAPPSPFSFHTILVVVLSAIQSVSGMCLALIQAYKQAVSTIKLVNLAKPSSAPPTPRPNLHSPVSPTSLSSTFPTKPSSSPAPSISSSSSSLPVHVISSTSPAFHAPPAVFPFSSTSTAKVSADRRDDYATLPLTLLSTLFSTHDRFAATAIMNVLTMLAESMSSFIDRLLPHLLSTFLSPAFILNTVRLSKRTLFPNGYPGLTPPDPTPEEQAELRARLLSWRPKSSLAHLLPLFLGPDPPATLAMTIEPLSSAPCNAHLVLIILDRILISLFPELGGNIEEAKTC